MTPDPLLDSLVADLKPVQPLRHRQLLAWVGGLCAIEVAVYLLLGQARSDLAEAVWLPSFWWKLSAPGAIAVAASTTTLRSLDPSVSPRRGLLAVACIVLGGLVFALALLPLWDDSNAISQRLMWRHGLACLRTMLVLSLPVIVPLGLLLRRGAPIDAKGSAISAGAAAGAWGAFVFAFNCPHDDPLYVAVWFTLSISAVTLMARLVLPFVSRW